jgi:Fe-S oxidoreductase
MTTQFAPGCALMLYKPHLAERIHRILAANVGPVDMLLTCCRHVPPLAPGTEVINICPGCDRRYRENYADASTISLWEVLVEKPLISLPDCGGREMTIIDACPTRGETRVHDAVRELVRRMNISLVEPANTRTKSTCCGDIFWGTVSTDRVVSEMKKKATEMPAEEVVVYCVSCAKAMFVGGKRPRYLIDLLFGEGTLPGTFEPAAWHAELDAYIASHT